MTQAELRTNFALRLAAQGRQADALDEEIYHYLSRAQDALTGEFFDSFEESRSDMTDLEPLVVRGASLPLTARGERALGFQQDRAALPTGFRELISAAVQIAYHPAGVTWTTPSGSRVPAEPYRSETRLVRFVQSDDVDRLLSDPFSRASLDPVAVIGEGSIDLFTGPLQVPLSLKLDYLKQPDPIDASTAPLLPEKRHWDLVDRAVQLFLTSIPQ